MVWRFLFNQTMNTELLRTSCCFYHFSFISFPPISFFLNYMGDVEAGRTEDKHKDTVNCKMTKPEWRKTICKQWKLGLGKCKTYWEKISSRDTEWKDMNKLQEQVDFLLLSFLNSVLVMLFHVTKHYKSQIKGASVYKMFCYLFSVRSC